MSGIIGNCVQMNMISDTIQKVAWSPSASVLILGESGTGKELIARAIHESGPFADQPFVEINCSALPDNLIETELFGYDAGAFTDAKKTKKGLLELADGGTFFMDEIGDLNLNLQVKLVKALEEKIFRRVGGTKNIRVTMRIMAATNRDLIDLIRQGRFREDLFYRLNVVAIHAPPLRERNDDIILLAEHFLKKAGDEHTRKVRGFTAKAKQQLRSYPWPGNVRELKNAVERAVLLGSDARIDSADLQLGAGHIVEEFPAQVHHNGRIQIDIPPHGISLDELEREAIKKAMRMANGNLSKAARLLHLTRETLRYRIKKYKVA
jgi:transcriptional regulator with PAS, ATPase and Fis domain